MIDDVLTPIHGGTDAGPTPRYDFSTNANSLGPDPYALAAIQAVDPSRYPIPSTPNCTRPWPRFMG